MKKGLKRFLSSMLTAAMAVSCIAIADTSSVGIETAQSVQAAVNYSGDVNITEAGGYQEGAYVEWKDYTGAVQYVVSYQLSGGEWVRIDDQLIRRYSDHWRADMVGLRAGTYSIKVDAYTSASAFKTSTVSNISVIAYDRTGFAFTAGGNTDTPGAYDKNGELKKGATVLYVTQENIDTITLTEGGLTGKGFGEGGITSESVHGKLASPGPLCIRIIGTVKPGSSDRILRVKASKKYKNMFVTFEGIGEDAFLNGGFDIQHSANVEIKNLGVGNFTDDGISIQSNNKYVWVHNVDLYYGAQGSDADQVKGDGSLDVKIDSQYCEFSYNHFWDAGKSSLCGMKNESGPNYISYHHNWFDHSDSRHPRIRTMSVHIYNNLFDGVAKYGVGVTYGGSAFVENNVFRNCKKTMLTSMQGTDIAGGKGTFSSENGGVIKAYNNSFINTGEPVYYSSSNNVEYDAYKATTRNETVPAAVKAKQGGTTYDNAGLAPSKLATPDAVDSVVSSVEKYAGSVGGGIIKDKAQYEVFNDSTDYGVDSALKGYVTNYNSWKDIVSVGGTVKGSSPVAPTEATTENTEPTSQAATEEEQTEETSKPAVSSSDYIHIFDDNSNESSFYSFGGSITTKGPSVTYKGAIYTDCLKMDSGGKIEFTNDVKGSLILVFDNTSKTRSIKIDSTPHTVDSTGVMTIKDIEPGKHTILKDSGETHIYYLEFVPDGQENTSEPTTSTTTTTTKTTTTTTTESTEATTSAPPGSPKKGDASGDGVVDMKDVSEILQYVVGKIKAVANEAMADVTGDGKITGSDAYKVSRYVNKLINSL